MSFLEDLPCSNARAFSGTIAMYQKYQGPITRSLGQGRTYLPESQDTEPPAGQGTLHDLVVGDVYLTSLSEPPNWIESRSILRLEFRQFFSSQPFLTRSCLEPSLTVIKTEEDNLLLRYLEKKSREGSRILEQTSLKAQPPNSMLTPTSPFRHSARDIRNGLSDQEFDEIDSSLETPTRLKRPRMLGE